MGALFAGLVIIPTWMLLTKVLECYPKVVEGIENVLDSFMDRTR